MKKVKPFFVDEIHIKIICPLCKKIHTHGSCGGSGYGGTRVAHCSEVKYMGQEYYIIEGDKK